MATDDARVQVTCLTAQDDVDSLVTMETGLGGGESSINLTVSHTTWKRSSTEELE